MTELSRGANAPLAGPAVEVAVSGARQGAVDLMVFQLADSGKVRSDADFVFFNQPASPEGAVRLTAADRVAVDLARIPPQVQRLAVAVSLDDSVPGSLAAIPGLAVTVADPGGPHTAPALGLTTERAAVLVEIYRRGADWKVRNVSAGWSAGLPALATEHGAQVDQPAADPLPPVVLPPAVPPPAVPPPGYPPPASALPPAGYPPPGSALPPAGYPPPPPAGYPPAGAGYPAAAASGYPPVAPVPQGYPPAAPGAQGHPPAGHQPAAAQPAQVGPGGYPLPGGSLAQPPQPPPFAPGGFPLPGGDLAQAAPPPPPVTPGGYPPPGSGYRQG